MRFVTILLEREKKFTEALDAAREALTFAPEDAILQRIAERLENGKSPYR